MKRISKIPFAVIVNSLVQFAGAIEYTNECPVYDTKQSDDEVPVILEL